MTWQRVILTGFGGAVGTTMLQLAREGGITAYGTDIAAKHQLIRSLAGHPSTRMPTIQC